MTTLLCPHWNPYHRTGKERAIFAEWNPPVVKIVWDADPPYLEDIPQDSQIVFRHYRNTDPEHRGFSSAADAKEKGEAKANFYGDMALRVKKENPGLDMDRIVWSGLNEPTLHTNEPADLVAIHEEAFVKRLHKRGRRAGVLNFSVGLPANRGGDTPPDWTPFDRVRQALHPDDWVIVNEYFAHNGPFGEVLPPHGAAGSPSWGWWAGRILKCPWEEVTIFVGELGIDQMVYQIDTNPKTRGWQGHADAGTYFAHLVEYMNTVAPDPRIVGLANYLYDQSGNWASHDTMGTPIPPMIIAHGKTWVRPGAPDPTEWGDERTDRWKDTCRQIGTKYFFDPRLLGTMIAWESRGDPDARGEYFPHPEVGLMQVIPSENPGFEDRPTTQQLEDPLFNVDTGGDILREYTNYLSRDLYRGIMAYNAGPGWVEDHPDATDTSTGYMKRISATWKELWGDVPFPWETSIVPAPTRARLRGAAFQSMGIALNPASAFYKTAVKWGIGAPRTNEYDVDGFRCQVWSGGDQTGDMILFARIGDWGNIEAINLLPGG